MEIIVRKSAFRGFGALAVLPLAVVAPPALAAAVNPNGSFTAEIIGTVDTGNITSATTMLTLTGGQSIGSFIDPFLGNANNFCGAAGNGCTAQHNPGYLLSGNTITESASVFPVGISEAFPDRVTAANATGTVTFDFTSISTNVLTNGELGLVLTGTFGGDTTGDYLSSQAADMSIICSQVQPGATIGCMETISSPPADPTTVPEPASLALLGSAVVGFGAFRRRRKIFRRK